LNQIARLRLMIGAAAFDQRDGARSAARSPERTSSANCVEDLSFSFLGFFTRRPLAAKIAILPDRKGFNTLHGTKAS
jgi:hypothetical protein